MSSSLMASVYAASKSPTLHYFLQQFGVYTVWLLMYNRTCTGSSRNNSTSCKLTHAYPLQNAVTEHYLPNMCPHTFCVGTQRIEKFHVKSLKHFLGARDPTQGLEDQRIFSCYLKQKRNFYQLLSVSICADLKGQTHSYVIVLSMQLSQLCTIGADSVVL